MSMVTMIPMITIPRLPSPRADGRLSGAMVRLLWYLLVFLAGMVSSDFIFSIFFCSSKGVYEKFGTKRQGQKHVEVDGKTTKKEIEM